MDDERLDALLADAERHYHRPPPAPVETIWAGVAEELYRRPARRRLPWATAGIAAAALLVGAVGGRLSVRTPPPATRAQLDPALDPADRATERLLGQTAVLLAALPSSRDTTLVDPSIAADGRRLLGTTRLLLDSPAADNARIRNLLLDLELVLAQVARLQHQRAHDELNFIQSALDERDIVPRLQSAVVDLSAGTH